MLTNQNDNSNQALSFTALINATVDCIIVINCRGLIERVNPAVLSLFGYSLDDLLGKNIKVLMGDFDESRHDGYLDNYLDSGEAQIIGVGREVIARKADGTHFPVYLSVGDFVDSDGRKFVGILRDLSEQKAKEKELERAELEIRELINDLAHVARISIMGEMAAGIAHEVNQPLAAINTYAQSCQRLLKSEPANLENIDKALAKISEQALRAGDIISGMRKWVKQHDSDRSSCNCSELIAEVIKIMMPEFRNRDVEIVTDIPESIPLVVADSLQVQQVLINLIRNGIEAAYDRLGEDSKVVIGIKVTLAEEGRIRIDVTDPGSGINQEVAHQLFDPFFTTKRQGMGMGLSICQTIIRSHGGKLGFNCDQGKSTTFHFTLPTQVK